MYWFQPLTLDNSNSENYLSNEFTKFADVFILGVAAMTIGFYLI